MTLTTESTKKKVDILLVPGVWDSDPESACVQEHRMYMQAIREIASGKLAGEEAMRVCKQLKRLQKPGLKRWFA
jgi:hypothetical protein